MTVLGDLIGGISGVVLVYIAGGVTKIYRRAVRHDREHMLTWRAFLMLAYDASDIKNRTDDLERGQGKAPPRPQADAVLEIRRMARQAGVPESELYYPRNGGHTP